MKAANRRTNVIPSIIINAIILMISVNLQNKNVRKLNACALLRSCYEMEILFCLWSSDLRAFLKKKKLILLISTRKNVFFFNCITMPNIKLIIYGQRRRKVVASTRRVGHPDCPVYERYICRQRAWYSLHYLECRAHD